MLNSSSSMFTVKDLQSFDSTAYNWFAENSADALAGRCLLDAIEYLRAGARLPGRFSDVADAHAVRLVIVCLSDNALQRVAILKRLSPHLNQVCVELLKGRKKESPHYGTDYWDWAAILECFIVLNKNVPKSCVKARSLKQEMEKFAQEAKKGLRTGREGEWYGPATATAAHRLLKDWSKASGNTIDPATIKALRAQALEPISGGKYRGFDLPVDHEAWHLGQVVAEFPSNSKAQASALARLNSVEAIADQSQRVYALARVIQGVQAVRDERTKEAALQALYSCQGLSRPFGQGIVADSVKGSLNVLEALWPNLRQQQKVRLQQMIDALTQAWRTTNSVGVLVAVPRELEAVRAKFKSRGAHIVSDDPQREFTATGKNYQAIVRLGKSIMGATDSTLKLIEKDRAKWVLMSGIAGSLGTKRLEDGTMSATAEAKFAGPVVGDVVVATSVAPFKIRDKVREQTRNAAVPLAGQTWEQIPTDPTLFGVLYQTALECFPETQEVRVYEGTIVSGTGIKDNLKEKADILKEWGGGLAVEEEGYILSLICLLKGVHFGVVRGISDLAEGDKIMQQASGGLEAKPQVTAAENAATVVVTAVEKLSLLW